MSLWSKRSLLSKAGYGPTLYMARAWSHSKGSCLFPLSCKGLSKQSAKLLLKSDLQIGARPWNSVFAKVTEEGVNSLQEHSDLLGPYEITHHEMRQTSPPPHVQFCFCSLQLKYRLIMH